MMATLVRRDDQLLATMTPQPDVGDSDHSSPHVTSSTMKDFVAINDVDSINSPPVKEPWDHDIKDIAADLEEKSNNKLEAVSSCTPTCTPSPTSYNIPAQLYESGEQQDENNNEASGLPLSRPPSGHECEDANNGGEKCAVCIGDKISPPPTRNQIHRRRGTASSIPHLLSTSNTFSEAGTQCIREQLSFVGIDTSLTPIIRSRTGSFAFSMDGDDSTFKRDVSNKSLIGAQIVNLKQSAASPLGLEINATSSSISLASVTSSYQTTPQQYNATTPLIPPISSITSPPHKIVNLSMQTLDMPQLTQNLMHQSTISPGKQYQSHSTTVEGARTVHQQTIISGYGLPKPSQPLPPPSNRLCPPAQPVALYSAINSLERYNAGSFDNKVMLAKVRGTYGKQKAFPGVPQKQNQSANNRVEETIGHSGKGRIRSNCNTTSTVTEQGIGEDSQKQLQTDTTSSILKRTAAAQTSICMEQTVPIKSEESQTRLFKSASAGNLGEKHMKLEAKREDSKSNRSVTIKEHQGQKSRRGRRREKKTVGVFRPSSDAYTPRIGNHRDLKYKPAEERECVEKISSSMGTIQRPNFRDALRRVAIILHQHIVKIEHRFSTGIHGVDDTGLFKVSMRDQFNEDNFATPRYKCSMVRVPMARPGVVYSMRKIRVVHTTPTTDEIYEFAHQLFKKVQLSSECSIVCLIYVEKLMEVAKVPLVAETWRPIFMCGLLLASKVWQDLSSWNIEFASVYPQFSLDAINRLELAFLKFIKWDLYISSSLYAKYYFALRSLLEKSGFRNRYNEMVGGNLGIAASEAMKVSKRSEALKEESILQLSRSM